MEITQQQQIQSKYYQSIYTHCKQRFNIPDGIEAVKKSVYQYIKNRINNYLLGNYNISEVKSNLYNNLVHYSQLETEDLNSQTLATYFQELNFNIIKYCEETYLVQSQYSIDFESETETSNKDKQKVKQYSRTTPNTPILSKTTAKYLQTPEQRTSIKLPLSITPFPILLVQPQTPNSPLNHFSRPEDFQSPRNFTQQQKPISTSTNIIEYLQENKSNHSENLESKKTESEQKETIKNEEEMTTAYIAKIPEFTSKDNNTSLQEWLDKVQKAGDANGWIAFENLEEPFKNWQTFNAFLQQFTDNNTSIILCNQFCNIKQETFKTILDQFIAGLKDKLIKKVHPHAPADLATAIRHAKNYEMAIEEANHTKLVNLAIRKTSSTPKEKIDQLTKKVENYFTNQQQQQQQPQRYQPPQQQNQNNFGSPSNNQPQNCHYFIINQLHNQCSNNISNLYQFSNIRHYPLNNIKYQPEDWFNITNSHLRINSVVITLVPQNSGQQRPNHYYTQPSYLTIPEGSDFQQTALFEGEAAALKSNPSNNTIPPAQIAQNANLSDIFLFEFEANKLPFLLSNAAANKQKAITAMYTEATVEGKPIQLILDSRLARSIITYQPAQTVIVIANGIKKTPVEEIDNFPFTIDEITIPVKVLIMDALQYQALIGNNWLLKANANLDWET
ncbi:hypothetical protein G9A89_020164 [Geosiphon pyriformis]|nr:hypothetical protein G9A89_020164 [Geosiphon pyriformis]